LDHQQGAFCAKPAKAPGKPASTFVNSAFALDELIQRFGMALVFQRVPQHARPFRPGALVDLCPQVLVPGTVHLQRDRDRHQLGQVAWLGRSVKAGDAAKEQMRGRLKINWTPTSIDTSHSTLKASGGRDYTSNAFGMQRKDFAA
jgi:hypothetical protein